MYKIIFITVAVFLLSGCTTSHAPLTEFRVNTELKAIDSDARQCLDKSLKIAQSFSTTAMMSVKMNYAQGVNKQYAYSESQWTDSPNRAINAEILKLIRDTNLFKSVQTSKSRSQSDFILEINIEDFMQYFNEDSTHSYANAVVSLSLLESATNRVIVAKTFKSRVDTKSLDASGGVEALNIALENILEEINKWLIGVCK